jgi:hypothetical protein
VFAELLQCQVRSFLAVHENSADVVGLIKFMFNVGESTGH